MSAPGGGRGRWSQDPWAVGLLVCLAFALGIAILGYALPWEDYGGELLGWVIDGLANPESHSAASVYLRMSLIASFAALVLSLALTVSAFAWPARRGVVIHGSSVCSSAATAGPLVYVMAILLAPSDWSDFSHLTGELIVSPSLGVGWLLALAGASSAGVLSVLAYYAVLARQPGTQPPGRDCSRTPKWPRTSDMMMAPMVIGVVACLASFYTPWVSGETLTVWEDTGRTWSYSGQDIFLGLLVPVSASAALIIGALSLHIGRSPGRVLMLNAQNVTAAALAMLVGFGAVLSKMDLDARSVMFRNVQLDLGWYLGVAGLVTMLASSLWIGRALRDSQ